MPNFPLPFPTFSPYRRHGLHYFLRGLDLLPNRLLHRFADQFDVPAEKYPAANAHMRLILGLTRRNKVDVTADNIALIRRRYHASSVMLQQPFKPDVSVQQDCSISNAVSEEMPCRLYFSKQPADSRFGVLFIHGGGFCIGNLDTHDEYCRRMAEITGWPVFAIEYRLAPEHPAPASLDDSLAAYRWLIGNPHSPFFDKEIILCGDSAGACLAALAAQHLHRDYPQLRQPAGQLLWYPVTDIAGSSYPSRREYGEGLTLNQTDFDAFAAHFLGESRIADPESWAPMQGQVQGTAPAFVVTAGLDMLCDEGLAYAEKLRGAGVSVKTAMFAGAPHGFLHLMSVHEETGEGIDRCLEQLCIWAEAGFVPEPA